MRNKKILIIDFDTKTLTSLSDFLQEKGFTVFTAVDGEEGLETYVSEKPDLIIMEPMLPKIHGFDLCAKITEESENGASIIIATGIYQENQCTREAFHYFEKSVFIKKPYTNEEIFDLIPPLLVSSIEKKPEEEQEKDPLSENSRDANKKAESRLNLRRVDMEEKIEEQINATIQSTKTNTSTKKKSPVINKDIDMMLKDTLSEFGLSQEEEEPRKKIEAQQREDPPEEEKPEQVHKNQEKDEEKKLPELAEAKTKDSLFGEFQNKKRNLVPLILISAAVLIAIIVIYAVFFRNPSLPNTLQASESQLSGLNIQQENNNSENTESGIIYRAVGEETAENPPISTPEQKETAEKTFPEDGLDPDGNSSSTSTSSEEESTTQSSKAPPEPTPKREPTIEYEDPEIAPPSILPEIQKALRSDVRASSDEETYAIKSSQEDSSSSDSTSTDPSEGGTILPEKTVMIGDLVPLTQVDTEPEPIKTVQPEYPRSAMAFNIQGQLVVNTLISENGDVLKTIIIRGIKNSKGLNESGEKAIQQWKFKPAIKDGIPVKVWKPISIAFKKEK